MFAENYVTEVEKRFIDVNVEGQNILNRFDILFESNGFGVAIDKQHDFTLNDSMLNIDFIKNLENPKVNALRVIEPYPTPHPTVIRSPAHNASFSAGLPIEFRATGEGSANWISNLDGSIGTGSSLDFSELSVGSHTITLEMSTLNSVIRTVSIKLDIIDPYIQWRDQQIWNGKDDSKEGDPDADSINNDLERAFGLNPLLADREGLPYPTIEEIESVRYFTLTYRRNLDATDLAYWIDSSTTLEPLSWSAETLDSENNESIEEDGRTQVMRFKHPIDHGPRFFRLRVE